jgi:uncharacterized protein (TIRG00374 family)
MILSVLSTACCQSLVTGVKFDVSVDEYKPKINLRKSIILAAIAIILMALAGWLLARENFYQMLEAVRSANHLLIAAAIAIYYLSVVVWAARWQTALSAINCKTRFGARYLILCATIFLNNITPFARVGGDPFGRVYMLNKLENTSYSAGMASSIGEHLLAPVVMVSFLMAGLFLRFGQGSLLLGSIIIAAWVLLSLGIIFGPRFFLKKKVAVRGISKFVSRVLGWFGKHKNTEEIMEELENFYSHTYATIDKGKTVLWIGLWSLLTGLLDIFRLYTIFLALGYYPDFSMLLIAYTLQPVVGLIPFLPGGLVLIEGSLISLFTLFGVPLNLAMAATAIERGISFVLSTVVGAGVFSYLGVRIAMKPEVQN